MLSALALGFVSCDPDTPCPNRKGAEPNTSQGVTVMLEMENVVTGETTRTALGEDGYSFTAKDGGGDVQALGLGFRRKPDRRNDIDVKLTYYAKENVVFQGWSWRYSEDPVGTHRGKTDAIQNDYVATPALQAESGVQKLALGDDATKFTCQYRPGTDNRVYVKVRYVKPTKKAQPFPNDLTGLSINPSRVDKLFDAAIGTTVWNNNYNALRAELIQFRRNYVAKYINVWKDKRANYYLDIFDDGFYNGSKGGTSKDDIPSIKREVLNLDKGIKEFSFYANSKDGSIKGLLECLLYVIQDKGRTNGSQYPSQEIPRAELGALYDLFGQVEHSGIPEMKRSMDLWPIFER